MRGTTASAELALHHDCRAELAGSEHRLPTAGSRAGKRPGGGRPRAGCEPLVEHRPLAPRTAALPAAFSAIHGEVGALLVPTRHDHHRGRRVPGSPWPRRRRSDRESGRPLPRRPRRRHVPGGDSPQQGSAQTARGSLALGRSAHRPRGRRAARACGDLGNRAARETEADPRRVRDRSRARRSRGDAARRGGEHRDRPFARSDRRPGALAGMSRPLLAVDGDSFAHRAYHALPKTAFRRSDGGPGNALEGFTNMLLRLWQGERPRAVVVAWDTLEVPTYRHTAFDGYQAGREFEAELLEQLDMLPGFISEARIVCVKAAGYEADDFLAAAAAKEEAAGGHALGATSDRDAFQLASERTTVLQPVRGSAPARIRPAEVRERYGVEPEQVPDLIALRGDPSDRIPGALGFGPKKAAEVVRRYGSLEAALAEGRFGAEAESLRLYKRVAMMDASAPLPSLAAQTPTWARGAALASAWGMGALAGRLEALAGAADRA